MKELLKLARETLNSYFDEKEVEVSDEIKKKFSQEKACFVTLSEDGELRGCIGSLYPRQELWREVVENTLNAAFSDTRFPAVISAEMKRIRIEISVLSIPQKINYDDLDELKEKISGKGVIIKKNYHSATYLPQVWNEIKQKEEFLSSLCQKAGLNKDAWKDKDIEILVYDVESVRE